MEQGGLFPDSPVFKSKCYMHFSFGIDMAVQITKDLISLVVYNFSIIFNNYIIIPETFSMANHINDVIDLLISLT